MDYRGAFVSRDCSEFVEEYRTICHRCGGEVSHGRYDVTRRFSIFWIPSWRVGPTQSVTRCRRCGHESHFRDVTDLASPTMKGKYTFALRAAVIDLVPAECDSVVRDAAVAAIATHYSTYTHAEFDADRAAGIDGQLDDALRELSVDASPHIALQLIKQLISVASTDQQDANRVTDALRSTATALNVTQLKLEQAVTASFDGD